MNKLNQKDKIKLMDYLFEFHFEIQTNQYNIQNVNLEDYCNNNSILLQTLNKTNQKKSKKFKSYILFKYEYDKKDNAHNILRHIRNSIAHGLIKKEKKFFFLSDFNKEHNITMIGKVDIECFYVLIDQIKLTKKYV